jgi:hypothetical protein
MEIDPQIIKAESEARIQALGGKVCDWLPWIDRTVLRTASEVCNRTLAMHAMLQLAFNAPKDAIRGWLEDNELLGSLSIRETQILSSIEEDLDAQTETNLYWYIEAIWALVWVGSFIPRIDITRPVGNDLASYLPNLQANEGAADFRTSFRRRPFAEIFKELDFYYRAHWYARDGQLNGYATQPFEIDIIMERRKALEWVCDVSTQDWDETQDST